MTRRLKLVQLRPLLKIRSSASAKQLSRLHEDIASLHLMCDATLDRNAAALTPRDVEEFAPIKSRLAAMVWALAEPWKRAHDNDPIAPPPDVNHPEVWREFLVEVMGEEDDDDE